jgi:hypothetical protein
VQGPEIKPQYPPQHTHKSSSTCCMNSSTYHHEPPTVSTVTSAVFWFREVLMNPPAQLHQLYSSRVHCLPGKCLTNPKTSGEDSLKMMAHGMIMITTTNTYTGSYSQCRKFQFSTSNLHTHTWKKERIV